MPIDIDSEFKRIVANYRNVGAENDEIPEGFYDVEWPVDPELQRASDASRGTQTGV